MATTPIPEYIENLRSNIAEVRRLIEIHVELTGTGPGRRHDVQVLNKSAILLLVATWEACVETLARTSVQFLIENSDSHEVVPAKARAAISRRLRRDNNENAIWDLAGEGWRDALEAQMSVTVGRLNTPNAANIDSLFEETLGLRHLSSHWYWTGADRKSVIDRLQNLIELRGEIAHKVEATRSVKKSYVNRSIDLVIRLAAISGNRVRGHLIRQTARTPWQSFRKGASR